MSECEGARRETPTPRNSFVHSLHARRTDVVIAFHLVHLDVRDRLRRLTVSGSTITGAIAHANARRAVNSVQDDAATVSPCSLFQRTCCSGDTSVARGHMSEDSRLVSHHGSSPDPRSSSWNNRARFRISLSYNAVNGDASAATTRCAITGCSGTCGRQRPRVTVIQEQDGRGFTLCPRHPR